MKFHKSTQVDMNTKKEILVADTEITVSTDLSVVQSRWQWASEPCPQGGADYKKWEIYVIAYDTFYFILIITNVSFRKILDLYYVPSCPA